MKKLPPQTTVPKVNLKRFMGPWHVIANIPTIFEKGAYQAIETYHWNESKKRIDIDFRFRKNSFEGPEKSIPQKGFVHNEETHAEWRVQPFWPLKFAYLIIDLASDYSYCMVGVPNRKHMWIMARAPHLDAKIYARLVAKANSLGYDTAKLEQVPQERKGSAKQAASY